MPSGFDSAAQTYDRARSVLIPDREVLYGTALSALPFAHDEVLAFADIGAGTGGFSAFLADKFCNSRFLLSDISAEMLEKAKVRFAGDARFTFEHKDMCEGGFGADLDAVVSALAIHHLGHRQKREVFGHAFQSLKPGGMFVNIDQFAARSSEVDKALRSQWLKDVRAAGADEGDLASAIARMDSLDVNAPVRDQLKWLEQAGFEQVDILYRRYFWAVFVARRPG